MLGMHINAVNEGGSDRLTLMTRNVVMTPYKNAKKNIIVFKMEFAVEMC